VEINFKYHGYRKTCMNVSGPALEPVHNPSMVVVFWLQQVLLELLVFGLVKN